ncbi:MAG TPA: polysaccharide deacetylase family protein [Sphingomonadaceae bacterium]|nr:polysaccharide deacetylase family protein [Sphingomonadaceae bacterium]
MRSITEAPARIDKARFRPAFGQRFILTVDTEEEFDWTKPIRREGYGLDHLSRLTKFQQFCENEGVCPVYLVDWPVATSAQAADILGDAVAQGRAEVGVQLHPWVNPPFDETVNNYNSFAGNLPPELEQAKFTRLREVIETNFGAVPKIYRAGRYGTGPNTARMLRQGGIAIDSSVRTKFDYSAEGGADYRKHPLEPYWLDTDHSLLELPLTTTFWGMLRRQGDLLYPLMWRAPSLRGVLSRLGLLERIPLTPEGVSVEEAIRGVDMALDDGLPLLVFSFHSPSLHPGHTPYVRNEEDLDALYGWWQRIFAYLGQRGVRSANVQQIMDAIEV